MGRLKKEKELPWMEDLARKHGISLETVQGFYFSINGRGTCFRNMRERTESFFDLYFEGVKEG